MVKASVNVQEYFNTIHFYISFHYSSLIAINVWYNKLIWKNIFHSADNIFSIRAAPTQIIIARSVKSCWLDYWSRFPVQTLGKVIPGCHAVQHPRPSGPFAPWPTTCAEPGIETAELIRKLVQQSRQRQGSQGKCWFIKYRVHAEINWTFVHELFSGVKS